MQYNDQSVSIWAMIRIGTDGKTENNKLLPATVSLDVDGGMQMLYTWRDVQIW